MSASTPARAPAVTSAFARWTPGPADPQLADGSVDVWRANLTRVGEDVVELLCASERERAERFAHDRDRALWERSRGVLRALLGRYLHEPARSVVLAVGPHGKPELSAVAGRQHRLFFNLSHSGPLALYAFTATGPVGVDVQVVREDSQRSPDHVALARRAFGEQAARRLGERKPSSREGEFLRLWTRHEAELKRRGTGIGRSESASAPDRAAEGGLPAVVGRAATPQAQSAILELDAGPRAAAALALGQSASELRLWEWPPRRSSG